MISDVKLIELYSVMIKSRMLAERAGDLKQQGKLTCDLHAGLGREGTIAGMTVDLQPEDTLSPSPCDFVSSVIKGMTLKQMFSRLGAHDRAHVEGAMIFDDQSNVIAPASELEARMEVARGAALVHKMAKNGRVVVVTCANGSASQDPWRDALAFAEAHMLPMLFVWHNDAEHDQELLHVPARRNGKHSSRKARSTPAITVDGTDAIAVYRVVNESLSRARIGRGSTLIECRTAPSPDPATANGASTDPIGRMELYLAAKGLFRNDLRQKITDSFLPELDTATRILDN